VISQVCGLWLGRRSIRGGGGGGGVSFRNWGGTIYVMKGVAGEDGEGLLQRVLAYDPASR